MAIRQRPAGGEETSHSGGGERSGQGKGQWGGGWSRGIGTEIQVGPGAWRGWLELQGSDWATARKQGHQSEAYLLAWTEVLPWRWGNVVLR